LVALGVCGVACDDGVQSNVTPNQIASGKLPAATLLASGAKISGANGILFGPDGLLYVASVVGSEIVALDPATGEVRRRLSRADGVDGPDDVAFAPDGTLYWTSILSGKVAGRRPDGSLVTAASLSPGVNPLTFSDAGRLFVAQCFFGDKLYEVDPDGVTAPRLISDTLGPRCGLNGMDWGPDQRLYGPRWFTGEVVSFDVDAKTMRIEASGFAVPAAVKFDSHGKLHVLDTMAGQVIRVDGDARTVVATLQPGLDNFAFDAADRLFVSSFVDGFVARIEPDGRVVELSPGGMATPGGVAVAERDAWPEVIVADLHALRGFDGDDGAPTFTARNILGVSPQGSALTVSSDGDRLVLSSWVDEAVRVWDPRAERLIEEHTGLASPVNAIRFGKGLAVALHGEHRVVLIDGEQSTPLADIAEPTGLVASDGDLFVLDRAGGTLLQIAAGGRAQPPRVIADGFSAPEGLARIADGFVIVEADSGRVVLLRDDGSRMQLAQLSPGSQASGSAPPSMVFNGVAAARDGTLYVTDEATRSLYRIDPARVE